MKNIFNSLGSNYDWSLAIRASFFAGKESDRLKLEKKLEKKYKGKVLLTHKGREAMEIALESLDLPSGSMIAINGFTCFSVYKAIVNANLKPCYLDIEKNDLNYSASTLEKALKNENIKAVIVQNTLGYPSNIEEISKICHSYGIFLIEDLAHSIGTKYENGVEAGLIGDFTVLSFSQDKVVDGVSGGALVTRSPKYEIKQKNSFSIGFIKLKERFYPINTWVIRNTYGFLRLGKIIHKLLKTLNLMPKPVVNEEKNITQYLPNWNCRLINEQFDSLWRDANHRKEIAMLYADNLEKSVLLKPMTDQIKNSANLRFPIMVNKRDELIDGLREKGILIADIWYDAPIAPRKYISMTDYSGECPNSESMSMKILNLPTHRNITIEDAKKIATTINDFVKESN